MIARSELDKQAAISEARSALTNYRLNRDASGFPYLRLYLARYGQGENSFDLSGFGVEDHGLNNKEYKQFKAKWITSLGRKADEWSAEDAACFPWL